MDNKILSDYEKFILIIEITNRLNSILPGFDINYDISYLDNTISINIYKYTDYNNENAKKALSCIEQLQYCEAHSSVILSETDIDTLKRLGIRLTSEDKFQFNRIYQK